LYLGQEAGLYGLSLGGERSGFAANLSDPAESAITPEPELKVGETRAGELEGFTVGARRELWVYFLVAVLVVSALEWLTYHRRVTV